MKQYITRLNISILLIIISVIVAIATHGWWYNHFNGGVVLFASHIDIKIKNKINVFLKPPKTPLVKTTKIDNWEALR